jgi:hypothetical protein
MNALCQAFYFYRNLLPEHNKQLPSPLQLHNRRRVARDLKRAECQRGEGQQQEKSESKGIEIGCVK